MSDQRQSSGAIISRASMEGPNVTACTEQSTDTRARAWRFVFDCWEAKKNAAGTSGGEDDGKGANSVPANASIP